VLERLTIHPVTDVREVLELALGEVAVVPAA
jgi:predicted ATP-dependent protease